MNVYQLADALEKIETYNQVIHRSFNDKTKLMASADMLRKQADRIAELEKFNKAILKKGGYPNKPLNDEEIYALWCEADNTELLPEMRLNDGSINYIITTFAKLIEERHGIK